MKKWHRLKAYVDIFSTSCFLYVLKLYSAIIHFGKNAFLLCLIFTIDNCLKDNWHSKSTLNVNIIVYKTDSVCLFVFSNFCTNLHFVFLYTLIFLSTLYSILK